MAVLRGDRTGDNRVQYFRLNKGEQEVTCSPLFYVL